MKKIIKYTIIMGILFILVGCGKNKETVDNETHEEAFRHNTKLVDKSVKPEMLNFKFDGEGIEQVTLAVTQKMFDKKDRVLTIPFVYSKENEKLFGKYEIKNLDNITKYESSNYRARYSIKTNDNVKISVNVTLSGPSGATTGRSEESFLNGAYPVTPEGGETYFFKDKVENLSNIKNTFADNIAAKGFVKKDDIKVSEAKEYYNDTFGAIRVDFVYGYASSYGVGANGSVEVINIKQQITDELFFDLRMECEYYEDNLVLNEENKIFDLSRAQEIQEKVEPTIMEILDIYGMKEQYKKLLSNGNDITSKF
ncbi:MAG: hypothetical protein HFE04_00870 [Bacilli bacterium]|nr:hypothetical protein [Bacilli bacterium]